MPRHNTLNSAALRIEQEFSKDAMKFTMDGGFNAYDFKDEEEDDADIEKLKALAGMLTRAPCSQCVRRQHGAAEFWFLSQSHEMHAPASKWLPAVADRAS